MDHLGDKTSIHESATRAFDDVFKKPLRRLGDGRYPESKRRGMGIMAVESVKSETGQFRGRYRDRN